MSDRAQILQGLRATRIAETGAAGAEDSGAAVAARLAAHRPPAAVPVVPAEAGPRIAQFTQKAVAAAADVVRVANWAALPAAIADALRSRNLGAAVRFGEDPAFAALDWSRVETSQGAGRIEEPVTLSRAACGVAETGTLVLLSGPDNPVTLAFLGEVHLVALGTEDLVGNFEEVWARLRSAGVDSRSVNLITGPSRSADIEQRLELGAHGPGTLVIFVIDRAGTG